MFDSCPFCRPVTDRVFYEGPLVLGMWDAFPVSPGHALLIPKRHVADWFEATPAEHEELIAALQTARKQIAATHQPDGFNIGINLGAAAGQTVFHLHVHLIPRYSGDVDDPRGGVRHVIPDRGNYLKKDKPQWSVGLPHGRTLVTGPADPLLAHLLPHMDQAIALDLAVAFILESGVAKVIGHIRDLLKRGGRLRLLTGDYLDVTDPAALFELLDLEGNKELRIFEARRLSFHPKSYIFHQSDGTGTAFVGSSNLSESALRTGVEWNYRVVSSRDKSGFADVTAAFDAIFHAPATRALDDAWVTAYAKRRRIPDPRTVEAAYETPLPPPQPHVIQREALTAMEASRAKGNTAGLVVLATGLGKTFLSAFDSNRPEYRRVLFVAHREEILTQAIAAYRSVRPLASIGRYTGFEKSPNVEVLFASIQTLGRQNHLDQFGAGDFDYVVVDEFHHAAAGTYRRLINYFAPKFLLGLTATPERTDGGDLLALCQENLIYRCDLIRGIELRLLCPFHYFGVPDEVDYANIPWRSSRFDEEELTKAVATQARAANILEQYKSRAGQRTIAFCCSQVHADFMAGYFKDHGVLALAVHSGRESAPRSTALGKLAAGEVSIIFVVDMFNEGLDLPEIDTVMMLRPTESEILWLQQFGRGLRNTPDKRLRVIDYIGNHRSFLIKPRTLFGLGPGDQEVAAALERVSAGTAEFPPGCEVTYDLETLDIIKSLLRISSGDETLKSYYRDFKERHGERPTAIEMFHDGYNPGAFRRGYGSWLGFVKAMGDLSGSQMAAMDEASEFLTALEVTPMSKSYKMLVLLAMLNHDRLPGSISIDDLTAEVNRLASRTAAIRADLGLKPDAERELRDLLERNPIRAWLDGKGTGGKQYFAFERGQFNCTLKMAGADRRQAFQELVRELVDWRLATYIQRPGQGSAEDDEFVAKVSHNAGGPIVFLPNRSRFSMPEGQTPVLVDGEPYQATFARVAMNVLTRLEGAKNLLPGVLRGWFGEDAGKSGTAFQVRFKREADQWVMSPVLGPSEQGPKLWRPYMREQIPKLFGFEFSTAIWNVGFVPVLGHLFLLVTLEKEDQQESFRYEDKFLGPDLFQWQSQNRTSQASKHGVAIKGHKEQKILVHLFVRRAKKVNSKSSPFIYCGDVQFVEWTGNQPITVQWKLSQPVPNHLRSELKVPEGK